MGDTAWFDKTVPGGNTALGKGEFENAVIVGDLAPDWVRLPPSLGGHQVKVLSTERARCPKECGGVHQTHRLEGGISVAECPTEGFLWFRTPTAT